MRNREVKTFPKSTYATRDAGIPVESQKESVAAAKNTEFFSLNASLHRSQIFRDLCAMQAQAAESSGYAGQFRRFLGRRI